MSSQPDDTGERLASSAPVPVVGVDLTDLTSTGEPDPLSGVLVDLCCCAARLVQLPRESLRAVFALEYLEGWCATDGDELPEFMALVRHTLRLLEVAGSVVDEAREVSA